MALTAPSAFTTPSSGGTLSVAINSFASYVNDTWVVVTNPSTTANEPRVRYASDPSGAWSTGTTLPASPSGYLRGRAIGPAVYVGGNYYIVTRYVALSGATTLRIYESSSLAGSWTAYDPGFATTDYWQTFAYMNGEFVVAGNDQSPSGTNPRPWIMASSSSAGGTWTRVAGSTSGLSGITQDWVFALFHDGSTYYRLLNRGPVSPTGGANPYYLWVETASSIGGTWTASTALPNPSSGAANYGGLATGALLVKDGTVIVPHGDGATYYTDDLSGSWSSASLPSGFVKSMYAAFGDGWYVLSGGSSTAFPTSPVVAYGQSLTSLALATDTLSSGGAMNVAYGANNFVVSDYGGTLNFAYAEGPPTTTGPRLLRQRQSPKRTPSRVRGVDLRQRQTPFIR